MYAAQGDRYWHPDPDHPIHLETWVVEVDGKIVCAVTARLTLEGFLTLDKSYGTPADRLEVIKALIEKTTFRARELGFMEVHIGVDPRERGWLRKLLSLPSMFLDKRFHVLLSVWHRFRR
jgi:hypothetical protein